MLDVSVVIVNWNTRDLLQKCLRQLYQETAGVAFEVIVVDNASKDDSVSVVEKEFPKVRLIKNKTNRGFAAANNQAIKVSKGRFVLLLNSDTIILDNAITKAVSFADVHPDAAVVGCRVLKPDNTVQLTCFMFPSVLNMFLSTTYLYKLFLKNRFFGREQMSWWNRDDVRQVDVVTGCFMLVRRRAIEQVGLMDERFFVYGEETDWCYRFRQNGWKILFTPDVQIIHFAGQSSKQMASKMTLQLRGSILQFMHKHRSWFEYKLAYVLIWLFFALRVPVWLITFIVKRTDYCRAKLTTYLTGMFKLTFYGSKGLCVKISD